MTMLFLTLNTLCELNSVAQPLSFVPLFVFVVPSRVKDRSDLFACPCAVPPSLPKTCP